MQALDESGFSENTLVLFITDNGMAVPFAKCNTWFHSSHSPLLVRWPGKVKAHSQNEHDFVSIVDFFPTFVEATGAKAPKALDGRSLLSLFKGDSQSGRDHVFTQIDSKAGGAAVPMRAIHDAKFGYIYNPFSDGKYWYRNNNEGKTMAAMNEAAKTDSQIAARVDLFRYRVPEEFYNLELDPNCLHNVIDEPKYADQVKLMKEMLESNLKKTTDPMLKAFKNMDNRKVVDQVLVATYGEQKTIWSQKRASSKEQIRQE